MSVRKDHRQLVTVADVGDFAVDINDVRIAEEIGRGAFGVVHRGVVNNLEQGELRTEVALKWSRGKFCKSRETNQCTYLTV